MAGGGEGKNGMNGEESISHARRAKISSDLPKGVRNRASKGSRKGGKKLVLTVKLG